MVKAVERFVVVAPIPGRPMAFGGTVLESLSNGQVVESALTEIPIEQLGEWVESLNAVAIADNLRLQGELSAMTAERDSLATDKAALTTERDSLQSQVAELTTSRDGLQTQLTEATTSLATATGQVEALTSERDSALEQVATLENRITELTAEPEVPIVSRRQARLALLQMGFFEAVESAVYDGPKAGQIEYEADTWRRDNPTLIVMAKSLGMSDEQIDQFFTLAGSK